jgi:hypothetical protein
MSLNFANNNSLSAITALPASISGGGLNLLSTQTASSSSTINFTSGIDSTYKEYIFKFINIHTASGDNRFLMNMSIDGGSNYNVTKQSTFFEAYVKEDGSDAQFNYTTARDLAQSTDYQRLTHDQGDGGDESACGIMHLFDPSNTTFAKHWVADMHNHTHYDYTYRTLVAGYVNNTSAVNAVSFKAHSGAIESGVIKLYGIS